MYQIAKGLWQGGYDFTWKDLTDRGITAVVSLVLECPRLDFNTPHVFMAIEDGEFPGIPWLTTIIAIIQDLQEGDHVVYVHCHAGISRSAMVAAAYFMKVRSCSCKQAIKHLVSKNPYTDPNQEFIDGLSNWQKVIES